ncbi:hypothetical protein QOL99_06370 [Deinococcus sp. MIMF12]|uniref:DUF680 domain-containing protein n=1 Tax=Deinococcus rhizophilus TaxID=3049544 RepID=A0ABT7JFD6_9DEIO|nr:hypothetical protein [Deinococcus rhizophilus]MDL2343770.1 hypothetical protein [Deinococcus rhizophilus]
MSLKKIMKVLAVLAALGISVAQAGANDYGVAKPIQQSAPQGADDYGVA